MGKKNKKPRELKQIYNSKENRKAWFRGFKKFLRFTGRYKKPEFRFLGEEFDRGALILSNHEGTDGPLSLELYTNKPLRMWGAGEMNSGLVQLYKYQTRVYYHQKKHWNLHLARLFCLIASPLTNMFYSGLNLISTWHDTRFVKTIKESIDALKCGENIVVFPEDSTNGYLDQLEGFHPGFVMLAETCYKRGMDLPIYVTYFNKKKLIYMVDKPVYYSTLAKDGRSREEIAKILAERCNELGRMTFDEEAKEEQKEEIKSLEEKHA